MKSHILRFALYGTAILIGFNVLTLIFLGIPDADSFGRGEIVGYGVIILSLVTVFLGMRSYRESVGLDAFSFKRAILLGLGITLGPAIGFGIYNLIYVTWIDPAFAEKYTSYLLEGARGTMSDAALQEYAAQIESQQAIFLNPWVQMMVMFVTVFLIGAIITLVSAMILRRRRATSAAG